MSPPIDVAKVDLAIAARSSTERAKLLIPGTARPAHLGDSIAAGNIRLGPGPMTALDRSAPR
jgi:aryl-alcohol dehydrogenase-like predicted oxidoreductase